MIDQHQRRCRSRMGDRYRRPRPAGPIRILKLSRAPDGRRTYLLGYTPESVPPGDYTLRIGIGEAGTRLESYSLLRVRAAEAAEADGDRAPAP